MILRKRSRYLAANEVDSPAANKEYTLSPFLRWAFYAFMFSLPYDVLAPSWLPSWLQGNLSIPRIVGFLLCLMFLLEMRPGRWKKPPVLNAFVAFFIVFTFSMLRSGSDYLLTVVAQAQMLALFFISYNIFLNRQLIRGALLSFALSCAIASLLMITGQIVDEVQVLTHAGRVSAFGVDPNIYSGMLVFGVLAAVGIGHIRKARVMRYRPVLWMIMFVTMIAIAQSGSRGSTASLVCSLAAFVIPKGSVVIHIRKIALGAAVVGIIIWKISTSDYSNVLFNRWEMTRDTGTTSGRDDIALVSLTLVRDRPLFGWGPTAMSELAKRRGERRYIRATHNMPLTMLTFGGIIGALPYFIAYIAVFRAAWRSRSGTENILPLAIFVGLFVQDMVCGGLPDKLHWILFAYLLAAGKLTSLGNRQKTVASRLLQVS